MNSQDSRYWRLLPEEYIVGKTWIIRKTMKKVFITGINILLAVFLMACASSDSKRLEQALLFAGDNRGELEKVLSHYENNPEKLREMAVTAMRKDFSWDVKDGSVYQYYNLLTAGHL